MLLLIAATFPLWFFVGQGDLPFVPLINLGISNADRLARVSTIGLIGGLIGIVVAPERLRLLWWLVAGSLLVSFLLDQHRLQPWAYQSAIYAVVFATLPPRRAQSWLIPLAASIYIYSSAGKFDYQFAHTVGQEFLDMLARPIGGLPEDWNQSHRARIALLFPAIEFLGGVGLLFRPTRRIAAVVVMLMHVVLLLILGPWGLGHSSGVLVWNIALLFQATFLFWYPAVRGSQSAVRGSPTPHPADRRSPSYSSHPLGAAAKRRPSVEQRRGQRPAPSFTLSILPVYGLVGCVLLAPLTERSGYWDHWTSWALYSPHNSRVDVQIHQSAIGDLPEPLRPLVKEDSDGDHWHGFSLQRWSLTARKVPIYPQARYQLGLCQEIARRYQLGEAIRLRQRSMSDRWTGERVERQWLGQREIQRALDQYWLTWQSD